MGNGNASTAKYQNSSTAKENKRLSYADIALRAEIDNLSARNFQISRS